MQNGETVHLIEVKDDHRIKNVRRFDKRFCDTVRIEALSTNGHGDIVIFEVRVY